MFFNKIKMMRETNKYSKKNTGTPELVLFDTTTMPSEETKVRLILNALSSYNP